MAYVYKIVNDVNNKIYIGKTEFSIEKRFKEHCRDAFKELKEIRPLYRAMRKYGLEHFHIFEIEQTDSPVEREKYWIEYYGSFKNGYNATLGGDGKSYCDYDLILALFNQGLNIKEISAKLQYSEDTCRRALREKGIKKEQIVDQGRNVIRKTIVQKDKKTGRVLNVFSSITEAYNYLGKQNSGHITAVCKGKRKTAYGYIWEYGY